MGGEKDEHHSPVPAGIQKVLSLIRGLRGHAVGVLIYEQIERLLAEHARESLDTERAYAAVLGVLLDAIAEQIPGHDPLRMQIRLVQRGLRPPLLPSELKVLQQYADHWAERLKTLSGTDDHVFRQALGALLQQFGVPPEQVAATVEQPPVEEHTPVTPFPGHAVQRGHAQPTAPEAEPEDRPIAPALGDEAQQLQYQLTHQLQETLQQHEELGVFLEVALKELGEQEDLRDIAETKRLILQEVRKFLARHRSLTGRLEQNYQTLQTIADDCHRLSDELTRARQLSLTDDMTGLPNRRAFQRRLEEEVARVSRYGFPLTLAMVDVDEFKEINDSYGHAVGDRVLVAYATRVLSIFRHHDMVCRYGGEEFAVLLPNTDLHGVLRALDKVKVKARDTMLRIEDLSLKLPTFSAGVGIYHPGETAESFVSRVDEALYEAKRLGRNRIEVAKEDQVVDNGEIHWREN